VVVEKVEEQEFSDVVSADEVKTPTKTEHKDSEPNADTQLNEAVKQELLTPHQPKFEKSATRTSIVDLESDKKEQLFPELNYQKFKNTDKSKLSAIMQKFRRLVQTIIFLNKTKYASNKDQFNLNKIIADEELKANF